MSRARIDSVTAACRATIENWLLPQPLMPILPLPSTLRDLSRPFTTQVAIASSIPDTFVLIWNDYTIPGWAAHDR